MIKIIRLHEYNWHEYSSRLQELEYAIDYPYGNDSFKIDHGRSYFAFFERLGETFFNVALDKDRVIGCGAGVIRKIPYYDDFVKSWYLCDLKVHPDYRKQGIPDLLFKKGLFLKYLMAQRGYTVSMNPAFEKNTVVETIKQFPLIPIDFQTNLNIYNFTSDQMLYLQPQLSEIVGKVSYLSLEGKKDLIMKSKGSKMKVLHVQHGPMAEHQMASPQEKYTHMISAYQGSRLNNFLSIHGMPSATASILSHRMNGVDWNFILTSDI